MGCGGRTLPEYLLQLASLVKPRGLYDRYQSLSIRAKHVVLQGTPARPARPQTSVCPNLLGNTRRLYFIEAHWVDCEKMTVSIISQWDFVFNMTIDL